MKGLLRRGARRLGVDVPPDEWSDTGRSRFLDSVLPKGGVGAEIGVHKGAFTRVLLEVTTPRKLHLVDPWYCLGREWSWGVGDRSTINALTRIMKRHEAALVDGSVELHIGDDLEILPTFPEGSFDWMYFDTKHTYKQTVMELALAATLVKADGVICGDDWRDDPNHPHYGVRVAVEELCAATDFELVYSSSIDRQWAVCRA